MSTDKKEKLFELESGEWILLSTVSGVRFFEKSKMVFNDIVIPDRIHIERLSSPPVDVEFEDEQKAKDYMSFLAKKVNDLNSEEKCKHFI